MHTLTPGDGDYYYRLDEHPTNPDAAAISTCHLLPVYALHSRKPRGFATQQAHMAYLSECVMPIAIVFYKVFHSRLPAMGAIDFLLAF